MRKVRSSQLISRLLAVCPDAYYTIVTTLRTRRRLGEEYTYIAMYKSKNFEEEGVLLNRNARILLTVLELLSRHVVVPSFVGFMDRKSDENARKDAFQACIEKIQR
jgi:hypothetical protein